MSKKYKKHGYAERLKYMHMLENGCSKNYIHTHYGIDDALLGHLWTRYQSDGPSGLLKKRNVKANYAFKLQVGKSVGKLCNKLIIKLYVTPWGSTKGVQK